MHNNYIPYLSFVQFCLSETSHMLLPATECTNPKLTYLETAGISRQAQNFVQSQVC